MRDSTQPHVKPFHVRDTCDARTRWNDRGRPGQVEWRAVRRRLLNFLTVLSLLLCVATCVLWVRSYAVSQFAGWSDPARFVGALSMCGLMRLEYGTYANDDQGWSYVSYPTPGGAAPGLWQEALARDRRGGRLRALGIAYARVDYATDGTRVRRALYLPHWLLGCATLAAPAWHLLRSVRARRRPAAGQCTACGYDLRATPGRCPECGRVAEPGW